MLGHGTLSDLDGLPAEDIVTTLRQHLIQQNRPAVIDAAATFQDLGRSITHGGNPATTPHPPFKQNSPQHQLLKMAHNTYYSENSFVIRINLLEGFLRNDPIADSEAASAINTLVRDIAVTIPIIHRLELNEGCMIVKQLQVLGEFAITERVLVELTGGGASDGSGWLTQETIRWISLVIGDLIAQFGRRFSIVRAFPNSKSRDIRPYWNAPSTILEQDINAGDALFQTIMQFRVRRA